MVLIGIGINIEVALWIIEGMSQIHNVSEGALIITSRGVRIYKSRLRGGRLRHLFYPATYNQMLVFMLRNANSCGEFGILNDSKFILP